MRKKWVLKRIPADYAGLAEEFGLDPVVIRVLVNRGLTTKEGIREFFDSSDALFDNAAGLPDLEKALEVIRHFKQDQVPVRIIGDYDIDGVCATGILLKGLRTYGLNVDSVIPHRVLDGYGMNDSLIRNAYEEGIRGIITCDNGISAKDSVELANSLGMEVVVTDHHEIPKELPDALALVDPKREESTYPHPEICGAYVAYKVVAQLLSGNFDRELRKELLILAGFATVGDVMPLSSENRSLVKYALAHIKEGSNIGLSALIRQTGLEEKEVTSYSFGFILGPCINATGRLDSAANALNLIMSEDEEEAAKLAELLHRMNEERKDITAKGQEDAIELIQSEGMNDSVLVIYLPNVHESIAGIIAGRVKETFYRPSFVFTDTEDGMIKGSGRSIEAYDMFAHLNECAELFTKFGGHPMAAGITMPKENLEAMRKFLNEHSGLSEEDRIPTVTIDADMPLSYVTVKVVEDLALLEPYGTGNEKPHFARKEVIFTGGRIVGKNKDVGIYTVKEPGSDRTFTMKLFRGVTEFHNYIDETYGAGSAEGIYNGREVKLKVAYYPDLNDFRGTVNVEFIMTDYE